jgi:uncharacterized protein (TIGR02996 family)
MRTFVFDDGKSHKFWNIELTGTSFTVTYGKVGTKGQTQTKSFPDAARAQKEHDKLVAEKLKKGYSETTSGAGSGTATTTTSAPAATPLRAALEESLVENPEDLATHSAYADHLTEQGDPRGEFIQVQLALENANLGVAASKPLQQREQELLKAHEREWLGPMASFWLDQEVPEWARESRPFNRCTWGRGWIMSLRIQNLTDEVAAAVAAQRRWLRILRELQIIERESYDGPEFETLLAGDFFGNIRVFRIGPDEARCHINGEGVVALVKKMPLLEELCASAHHVETPELFSLPLPHLRKLRVEHVCEYPLEILAANKSLTNLTHLSLWPHALEPGDSAAYITCAGASALFWSPHLKSLTDLELRNSDTGDEGIAALVESGMLRRLKTLSLDGGCITDEGARTLAACKDLTHLESLRLCDNMIGDEGQAALRDTGVNVAFGQQFDPDDREEFEYLMDGDWE